MELLKQKTKDVVSGANVDMPQGLLKPLDYSIDLIIRTHPTLREYQNQLNSTETDPEYTLYPKPRDREEMKDEVLLKNAKKEKDVSFARSLTRTRGGAVVNEMAISGQEMPGNFGIRVIETMPTNVRDVYIQQRKNLDLDYNCDYRINEVPSSLPQPDVNDYLTDEDTDDAPDFSVKVPDLQELLNQFEDDETIKEHNDNNQATLDDMKKRGFEPEQRHEIENKHKERCLLLNSNIGMQRQQQVSLLPGMIQDLNEETILAKNKMYLR